MARKSIEQLRRYIREEANLVARLEKLARRRERALVEGTWGPEHSQFDVEQELLDSLREARSHRLRASRRVVREHEIPEGDLRGFSSVISPGLRADLDRLLDAGQRLGRTQRRLESLLRDALASIEFAVGTITAAVSDTPVYGPGGFKQQLSRPSMISMRR